MVNTLLYILFLGATSVNTHCSHDSICIDGVAISSKMMLKNLELQRSSVLGGQTILRSKVEGTTQQHFRFMLPRSIRRGVYTIPLSNPMSNIKDIDIIINGIDSLVRIQYFYEKQSKIVFHGSEENAKYQYLLQQEDSIYNIYANLENKMKESKLKSSVSDSLCRVEEAYNKLLNIYCKKHPNTISAAIISNTRRKFVDPAMSGELKERYLYKHYWDGVDTENLVLLNTSVYNHLISDYLLQFSKTNLNMNSEIFSDSLIHLTDTILNKFKRSNRTYEFAVKYLEGLYYNLGQYQALQYVDVFYTDSHCSNNIDSDDDKILAANYKKRIEGMKITAEGMPAPEIYYLSDSGKELGLKDIKADSLIVIFWSPQCNLCMKQMPLIDHFIMSHPRFAAVAVCQDPSAEDYEIMKKNYSHLVHTIDAQEKEMPTPSSRYYVTGTPTYFLLDKDRKFLGTYYSLNSLTNNINMSLQN
jgi:hypothetical protein